MVKQKEDIQGLTSHFVGVSRRDLIATMTPRELILGDQADDNEVSTILGKCRVVRRAPLSKKMTKDETPPYRYCGRRCFCRCSFSGRGRPTPWCLCLPLRFDPSSSRQSRCCGYCRLQSRTMARILAWTLAMTLGSPVGDTYHSRGCKARPR